MFRKKNNKSKNFLTVKIKSEFTILFPENYKRKQIEKNIKSFFPQKTKIDSLQINIISENNNKNFSPLEIAERKVIFENLENFNGNATATKNHLKITHNTLRAKMQKYKIFIHGNKPFYKK